MFFITQSPPPCSRPHAATGGVPHQCGAVLYVADDEQLPGVPRARPLCMALPAMAPELVSLSIRAKVFFSLFAFDSLERTPTIPMVPTCSSDLFLIPDFINFSLSKKDVYFVAW